MRWIYLSPHLDDVVLSSGGLVWEQTQAAEPVEVWTIFAGDPPPPPYTPFAAELHARWGTPGSSAAAVRRSEDVDACLVLGAKVRHGELPDCIYRRLQGSQQPVIRERDDLFKPYPPEESVLVEQIAAWIRAALPAGTAPSSRGVDTLASLRGTDISSSPGGTDASSLSPGTSASSPPWGTGASSSPWGASASSSPWGAGTNLVSPMALGGHIDHRLVRAAAESLNIPLWFYADYPYAVDDPLNHGDLRGDLSAYHPALVQGLSPQALTAWQSAIAAYTSQISTFWGSLDQMRARIAAYHLEGGGCMLWQRPA
jgi:LmbE family N-acetylglucosaminyl deacetylase